MVVDDEEGILDSIQALLNRNGYWCACFLQPLEALEELKREHYDLLILDYFMQPSTARKWCRRYARPTPSLHTAADRP